MSCKTKTCVLSLMLFSTLTSFQVNATTNERTLSIPEELTSLLTEPTNPYKLPEKPPRKENEELVEGIKSADGRWFDVEIVIFERTLDKPTREQFRQEVLNKKPNRAWELQNSKLFPDITRLLQNLPRCHQDKDPFVINERKQENGLPSLTAAEFFNSYIEYQSLIANQWQLTNINCLLPSESLPLYWQLVEDINFLPNESQSLYTHYKPAQMPVTLSGYDYDDYRDVYLLDQENLKLTGHAEKIDKHWGTKTLLHIGWRQPGLAPNQAIPVYIKAGKNYTDEFTYDGHAIYIVKQQDTYDSEAASPLLSSDQVMMNTVATNVEKFVSKLNSGAVVDTATNELIVPDVKSYPTETWQLDGTIKVHLDHYLYLAADFNYRELQSKTIDVDELLAKESSTSSDIAENDLTIGPQNVLISAANKDKAVSEFNEFNESGSTGRQDDSLLEIQYLQNFPFKQLRRTYSGDLHYLDHPKYGVLFQIRKYRH